MLYIGLTERNRSNYLPNIDMYNLKYNLGLGPDPNSVEIKFEFPFNLAPDMESCTWNLNSFLTLLKLPGLR